MTEQERTVIRLVGLVVHALGLVASVAALAGAAWPPLLAGLVTFAIGGAWGWGMVALASHEDAQRRRDEVAAAERARAFEHRSGFTSRFDDEPEPHVGPPPSAILRADRPI